MSTRYNTQSPIESDDVRDMSDNAKNLDLFSNSSELSFADRLGVERQTIYGMNSEFNDQILNMGFSRVGTFSSGATLTNPRQTLLWDTANGGDGQEYGWSGTFPKIVPPSSTPSSTGGIAVGAWMSRFDPELKVQVREALRRSYAEAGYDLIGTFSNTGLVVDDVTDVVLWELTGVAYAYSGTLPHTIGAGEAPVGNPQWASKSNELLKKDLYSSAIVVAGLAELQAISSTKLGLHIRVKNAQDVDHIRVLSSTSDATGILTNGGLYANLVLVEPNKVYSSQLFVTAGSDQTTLLNTTLKPYISANEIREIVLDTGDILVTNTLDYVYGGVGFTGKGKLLTNSIDNVLQRTKTQWAGKKYHGDYNFGTMYGDAFREAVAVRKEVRVVLFGDSISVGGDYDSFGIAPGVRETAGVDNEDRHDCLASTLFHELIAIVPTGVRVRVYPRSVAGLAYANISAAWDSIGANWSGRDGVVAGRSWRDCVLALQPDLIIHSMGMNESPVSYYTNFKSMWHDYISTAAILKNKTFDQAILTTPNPNFTDGTPYGDFRTYDLNASKFFVASLQRIVARRFGYSLIDVAFNSTLKRYGIDPRSVTFEKSQSLKFTDGTSSKTIAAGASQLTTTLSSPDQPLYSSTTFTLNIPVASDTAGLDFLFVAGLVKVQFVVGEIRIYDSQQGGSPLAPTVATFPYVFPAATSWAITVTITPDSIYVYIDGFLKANMHNPNLTKTLPIAFNNETSSYTASVSNITCATGLFARYSEDSITDGDFYGKLDWHSNPYGGGINHPSATMLGEVYIPPVREFFDKTSNTQSAASTHIGGTLTNEVVYIGRVLVSTDNIAQINIHGFNIDKKIAFTINASGDAVVYTNNTTAPVISLYYDKSDGAVFMKNTTASIVWVDLYGGWTSRRPSKTGVTSTPRGALLPIV